MAERPSSQAVILVAAVLALAAIPAGCGQQATGATVQRIVVCAGPSKDHPAGTRALITFVQGGKQVAAVNSEVGALTAVLVPELPTAVLLDGREMGAVGWDGQDPNPSVASSTAPDEATIADADAADPAEVHGFTGITGPGCPAADTFKATG